jgi:hypothetical protein
MRRTVLRSSSRLVVAGVPLGALLFLALAFLTAIADTDLGTGRHVAAAALAVVAAAAVAAAVLRPRLGLTVGAVLVIGLVVGSATRRFPPYVVTSPSIDLRALVEHASWTATVPAVGAAVVAAAAASSRARRGGRASAAPAARGRAHRGLSRIR